jgi:putative restriction endonuclease
MKSINQHQRAKKAWEVLIQVAKREDFLQYKELGGKIGIHHRAIRFVLAIIQDYCSLNNLPPLTILVGNKLGIPGKGFTAWDSSNIKEGKHKVYNHNWGEEPNPFLFAIDGTNEQEVIKSLITNPQNSDEVYRKIKSRGYSQIVFRKALLVAYKSKCAFCNTSLNSILQAAHIIPWNSANDKQKLDVRNGLLLCANHHCLFDYGILFVDELFRIQINKKVSLKTESDKIIVSTLSNTLLQLPKDSTLYPNIEYLKYRNKTLK